MASFNISILMMSLIPFPALWSLQSPVLITNFLTCFRKSERHLMFNVDNSVFVFSL